MNTWYFAYFFASPGLFGLACRSVTNKFWLQHTIVLSLNSLSSAGTSQFGKCRGFRLHSSHQRLSSPAALGSCTTDSRWGTGEAVVSRWVGAQRRRSKRKQWPQNISPCNDPTWLVKRPFILFLRLISLMKIWDNSLSPELFDYELKVPSIVNSSFAHMVRTNSMGCKQVTYLLSQNDHVAFRRPMSPEDFVQVLKQILRLQGLGSNRNHMHCVLIPCY